MIYKVLFDGVSIYDEYYDVKLLSPNLSMELNAAGSFSFKLPLSNIQYDLPKILTQTVEIYEGSNLLWFGRPLEISKDFYNQKEVYCEGALSFFNDSLQRPQKWDSVYIHDFFRILIANHNSQVPPNRQFTVGTIEVDNIAVFRRLDYQTTLTCLIDMCVNAEGGYLVLRRSEGVNYIDWVRGITEISNQPAQFGLNILDLSQVVSGADVATCIVPIGNGGNGKKLTIKYINDGIDHLDSPAISTFGRITRIVEFNLSKREKLIEAGRKWLEDQQWDPLSITVDVAELSYLEPKFDGFKVGQIVHCTSTPHLIDKKFPILKISLDLSTAKKKITIGTTPPRLLTEIYKTRTESRYEDVEYD